MVNMKACRTWLKKGNQQRPTIFQFCSILAYVFSAMFARLTTQRVLADKLRRFTLIGCLPHKHNSKCGIVQQIEPAALLQNTFYYLSRKSNLTMSNNFFETSHDTALVRWSLIFQTTIGHLVCILETTLKVADHVSCFRFDMTAELQCNHAQTTKS